MNLVELGEMGLLKATLVPASASWIPDAAKALLVRLYVVRPGGLPRASFKKPTQDDADALLVLEAHGFVQWISDQRGKATLLTLTWKGEEFAQALAEIAKSQTQKPPYSAANP